MAKIVTREIVDKTEENVVILRITNDNSDAENTAFGVASTYKPLIKKVDGDGSQYSGKNTDANLVRVEVWNDFTLTNFDNNPGQIPD